MNLRLVSIDFDEVEFAAESDGEQRYVSVLVSGGRNWLAACRFPHIMNECGASLGNDELDEQVRVRASEELVRLAAATNLAREIAA